MIPIKVLNKRSCGECTGCCEGWLSADIYGYKMCKGSPCLHLKKVGVNNCDIYERRPQGCKSYDCMWLTNTDIPEWMRPDRSKVILTNRAFVDKQSKKNFDYIKMTEAGQTVDSQILSDVIQYAQQAGQNLEYEVNGVNFYLGTAEFLQAVKANIKYE